MSRPKFFYVVGHPEDLLPALARGSFEGLTGVSDTPDILNEFLWLRSCAVAMPSESLLEVNDSPILCQIDYDDPDGLAAENMMLFGRLYNNPEQTRSDYSSRLTKFSDKLKQALTLSEKSGAVYLVNTIQYYGLSDHDTADKLADGEWHIDSAGDLARILWDHAVIRSTRYEVTKGAREILQKHHPEYTFKEFLAAVKHALVIGGSYYSNEGEWIVQQTTLNIPEDSIVIFADGGSRSKLFYDPSDKEGLHEQRRKKSKALEDLGFEAGEEYTKRELAQISGIDDLYDVRLVSAKHLEKKRDRRAPKLHTRLQVARERRFDNPSLMAEFWGDQGAGVYIVAQDTGRVLLTYRSAHVNEPHTWGIPGGAIDEGESPARASRREVREELGYDGDMDLFPLPTFSKGTFVYHNHLGVVDKEFEPVLDWENEDADWFYLDELDDLDLHPGVAWMLDTKALS